MVFNSSVLLILKVKYVSCVLSFSLPPFSFLFLFFKVKIWLIYSILSISAVRQSDPVICITYTLFLILSSIRDPEFLLPPAVQVQQRDKAGQGKPV